MQAIN